VTGPEQRRSLEEAIVNTVREPLIVLDDGLRVVVASRSFYRAFAVTPEETEGRPLQELGNGQWNIPALRELLTEVIPRHIGEIVVCFESSVTAWRLAVSDEGVGISRRLPDANIRVGLGTSIVEALTRQLGGRITTSVASPPPGTIVSVTVPRVVLTS